MIPPEIRDVVSRGSLIGTTANPTCRQQVLLDGTLPGSPLHRACYAFGSHLRMRKSMSLEFITQQVKQEILKLTQVLGLLDGAGAKQTKTKRQGKATRRAHVVSAASRQKMAQAQRARLAKIRGHNQSISVETK